MLAPPADALDLVASSRYALLGELHDNAALHQLRLRWLEALSGRQRFAIAMEQFDTDAQAAIDARFIEIRKRLAQAGQGAPSGTQGNAAGPNPQASLAAQARELAEAGGFSFEGWDWPLYEPVVALALRLDLPLVAANLSNREAARIARGGVLPRGARPDDWSDADQAAMAAAIRDGHCGLLPERAIAAMVDAQLARDHTMAVAMHRCWLSDALPVVLLAGNGHVRADIAVPRQLRELDPGAGIVAIGFGETASEPAGGEPAGRFDRFYRVEPVPREDPCVAMRRRLAEGSGAARTDRGLDSTPTAS